MVNIGVIGAGAVGLCTAINIQKRMPDAQVTVIADKFGADTTSYGAGGFFRPYMEHFVTMDEETVKQWIKASWEFFHSLATSEEAAESGQSFVSGTLAYRTPKDDQYYLLKEFGCDFHQVSEDFLKRMKIGHKYKYGYNYKTIISQPPQFLVWLMKQFREAGGKVQHKRVQQLTDLCGEFDIVANCSGLGARDLNNDDQMFPVKGHLVKVHAPWMKHFFYCEDDIYVIPHDNCVHIGGIRVKGDYSMTADPATREHIMSRAQELFPQLKGAKILGEWVGLRPARTVIRCESEVLNCGPKGKLAVVHNYGHGGHGITLSWGSSLQAARLVQEMARGGRSKL